MKFSAFDRSLVIGDHWYPNVQTTIGITGGWPSEKPGARGGAGRKSLPKLPMQLAIFASDFLSPQNQIDTKNNSNSDWVHMGYE